MQCLTAASATAFADGARQAEDLGYSTLFIPDHFVDHPLAPVPAMATAAALTTTLNVGALVFGNDYQHPVTLACELATIDLLSDGRLEMGIGAGWMTVDYEKAGFTLDRPGVQSLVGFVHFTDDRAGMAAAIAPAFGTTEDRAFETMALLVGTAEQMIDDLHSWRDRRDISYVVVPQEVAVEFAPVVAALAGF